MMINGTQANEMLRGIPRNTKEHHETQKLIENQFREFLVQKFASWNLPMETQENMWLEAKDLSSDYISMEGYYDSLNEYEQGLHRKRSILHRSH